MRSDKPPSKACIFLDRDGVIIENVAHYVRALEDIRFIPGALEALAQIRQTNYRIVIVSNQSVVGRGIIGKDRANSIQQAIVKRIEVAGGRIDGSFLCFHQPSDRCDCRKPRPGLVLQAADQMDLDLGRSILIGDAVSDVQAGLSAGVGRVALVKTGRGAEQLKLLSDQERNVVSVYPNLALAINGLTD